MEAVATLFPFVVVHVMVAEPLLCALTTPVGDTVAIPLLLDDHLTVLSLALDGLMLAINSLVPFDGSVTVAGEIVIEFTATSTLLTVILEVAVFPPSAVLTVITAEPFPLVVTNPVEFTVATAVLLEVQLTFLFEAFAGATVLFN
jgi:hypothetical protein